MDQQTEALLAEIEAREQKAAKDAEIAALKSTIAASLRKSLE